MREGSVSGLGPVSFALFWLGIAVVAVFVVGLVAGLVRDDVAGTLGPVVSIGLSAAAIGIVVALAVRRTPNS